MKFEFDQETHIGKVDGVVWPSVTQLLNLFKLIDYSDVPDDVLENKRILGTRVHCATGLIDDCNLDEDHAIENFPEILPYLEAYRLFRVVEKFDRAETRAGRMWSKSYKFHGEPDEHGVHLLSRDTDYYLIDYKTCWKHYESVGPQTAAYALLLKENLKINVKKRFSLLLKPTGHYELIPLTDNNDLQDFKACVWLYWQRVNKYKTL